MARAASNSPLATLVNALATAALLIGGGAANSSAEDYTESSSRWVSADIHLSDVKARVAPDKSTPIELPQLRRLINNSVGRRPELAALIRPMFASMPQSAPGEIGDAATRYVLHRLFSKRHGWIIRGLQASNEVLKESVVYSYIKAVVGELNAGDRGLSLQELAVVAGVIEELTHEEALGKLHAVFSHYSGDYEVGRSMRKLPEDHIALAVAMAMSHEIDAPVVDAFLTGAWNEAYVGDWEVQKYYVWLLDVQFDRAFTERHLSNPFVRRPHDFNFAVRVLEQVGARHGKWQDLECRSLKDALVELDEKSLGRVPLPNFYGAQLWGTTPPPFQFIETEDYLRKLGALDETDRGRPGIMVPNYVNAFSNCVLSTDVYSTCCIDECEELIGHIEAAVQAPTGSPEQIAAIVANLSSDTVTAPRQLSDSLVNRLSGIAALDPLGMVPLHSRLFAQWLHHAYPYECSFPRSAADGDEALQQPAHAWAEEEVRLQGVIDASSDQIEAIYASAAERHALAEGSDERLHNADPVELRWTNDDRSPFHGVAAPLPAAPPPFSWTRVGSALAAAALLLSAGAHFCWNAWSSAVVAMRGTNVPSKDISAII